MIFPAMKLLVLLSALVVSSHAGMMSKKLSKRVMEMSLLQDCWGPKNMAGYMKMVKDAADECQEMEPLLTEEDLFGGDQLPRGPKAEEVEVSI